MIYLFLLSDILGKIKFCLTHQSLSALHINKHWFFDWSFYWLPNQNDQCIIHIVFETIYSYILYVFINITGCPKPGFYGENCSKPCPQNCQEGHCHITEGTCLGCIAGYRGPNCSKGESYWLNMNHVMNPTSRHVLVFLFSFLSHGLILKRIIMFLYIFLSIIQSRVYWGLIFM